MSNEELRYDENDPVGRVLTVVRDIVDGVAPETPNDEAMPIILRLLFGINVCRRLVRKALIQSGFPAEYLEQAERAGANADLWKDLGYEGLQCPPELSDPDAYVAELGPAAAGAAVAKANAVAMYNECTLLLAKHEREIDREVGAGRSASGALSSTIAAFLLRNVALRRLEVAGVPKAVLADVEVAAEMLAKVVVAQVQERVAKQEEGSDGTPNTSN